MKPPAHLVRSLLIVVAPALLTQLWPALAQVAVYDRGAILQGELWRLWTGHWVHFGASHFGWNVAALAVLAGWLEKRRPGIFLGFAAAGAPLISLGLLAADPELQRFGGLSGLATGALVLLCLTQLRLSATFRTPWVLLLGLVVAKTLFEARAHDAVFSQLPGAVVSSWLSHLLGVLTAVLFFAVRLRPAQSPPPSAPRRRAAGGTPLVRGASPHSQTSARSPTPAPR